MLPHSGLTTAGLNCLHARLQIAHAGTVATWVSAGSALPWVTLQPLIHPPVFAFLDISGTHLSYILHHSRVDSEREMMALKKL